MKNKKYPDLRADNIETFETINKVSKGISKKTEQTNTILARGFYKHSLAQKEGN